MTKVIHKWTLPSGPGIDVHKMPREHKFLAARAWLKDIDMWFEVDDEHPQVDTLFQTVGTGSEVPEGHTYVTTYFEGPFVWHVYKRDNA